jgi:hypothetical protein
MAPSPEGSDDVLWSDLPKGPLSVYRERASFSCRELLLFWEGEDVLRFKVRLGGLGPRDVGSLQGVRSLADMDLQHRSHVASLASPLCKMG